MKIHELSLSVASAAVLAAQRRFYSEKFGFEVRMHDERQFSVQVGESLLMFYVAADAVAHRYHFAFNVPSNRFADAVAWLRVRVPLIADRAGRELFADYEIWNVDNVYFYDPAGNIGELIARHTLPHSDGPLSQAMISCVSEIGLGCDDLQATADALRALTGALPYHWMPPAAGFAPVGDEHGLFILVPNGRLWFPDTGVPATAAPFRALVQNAVGQQIVVDSATILSVP